MGGGGVYSRGCKDKVDCFSSDEADDHVLALPAIAPLHLKDNNLH
jgi:hypothetical protein